jgi:hypothetical protein
VPSSASFASIAQDGAKKTSVALVISRAHSTTLNMLISVGNTNS